MNSTQKMLWRHFASGRLNILLAAIVIATASLTAITLVAGAVHNTITKQARYSLAADAQVRGSKPIPEQWLELSSQNHLKTAQAVHFRAMTFSEDANILTAVKAVTESYPLLGELTISDIPYGDNRTVPHGPAPGTAWLSPRLFAGLNIEPGDTIEIGEKTLLATKSLVREPDSLQSAFNTAPRVMIHKDDVAATGAVQIGSRVSYSLMLAGTEGNLQHFKANIGLGTDFRWRTVEDSNQRLSSTLDKATEFIRLGGVLSIILAAIGIALATRSYAAEQIPQVALLKTLGATPAKIMRLYSVHVAIIAGTGTAVGLALGGLLYQLIKVSVHALLSDIAAPGFAHLLFPAALSITIFVVFAAPYFLYLRKISPLLVLQQGHNASLMNNWQSVLLGSLAAFGLCALFSGNVALTAYVFAGLAVCGLLAVLCGLGVIYFATFITKHAGTTVRLGVANLVRHKIHTAPQIMMFSMLFMLIFTLIMVRTSLLTNWQAQLPEHAPNHYIYNIFEGEREQISDTLKQHNIEQQPVYPIFGGRLAKVNGNSPKPLISNAQNQVNYEREFGLTWSQTLGDDNRVVKGRWWTADDDALLLSVEENFAHGLGLTVGDSVTVSTGGTHVRAEISSIRSVQWDSMNLNFYLIFNKPPTEVVNANWATSFYLGAEQKNVVNQLARRYPTVSIIELDQTIAQVKDIISRVSLSIELITLLILGSGCVILIASIQSTYQTRLQEGAILRTFGASRRTVQRLNLIEFGAIGLASGLLATVGAEVALWFVGKRILQSDLPLHWPLWLLGPASVMAIIIAITSAFTKQLHQQAPMKVIKSL